MSLQNLSNGLANFNWPKWLLKRIVIMNIAITRKIDLMANKVRKRVLLLAVLSSVIVLNACSTNPERSSKAKSIPVSESSYVKSEGSSEDTSESTSEDKKESDTVSEHKVKASTILPPKAKSVVKPVAKNKTTKPSVGKKNVSKKIKVKKEKIVSKKTKKKIEKIVSKKTKRIIENEAVAKPSVEPLPAVIQTNIIKKPTEYKVALEKLPLLIGDYWTLSRDTDSDGECALSYRKVVMEDGQGKTPVFVIITQDEVLFKTKSNIDVSYQQTGLTIDDLPQLPIEKLHNDFSISYQAQYRTLVESMAVGEQAVLTLGFWPSWPVTHTYSISLDLSKFSSAQQALMTCLELEKELK